MSALLNSGSTLDFNPGANLSRTTDADHELCRTDAEHEHNLRACCITVTFGSTHHRIGTRQGCRSQGFLAAHPAHNVGTLPGRPVPPNVSVLVISARRLSP